MAKARETRYSMEEYVVIRRLSQAVAEGLRQWDDLLPRTLKKWDETFKKFNARKIKP